MRFILTPPLVVKNSTGFAVLQVGEMELPESLVITMAEWSALQLMIHWRREMEMLLSGSRDRGCVVSGLVLTENVTVPSEWWKMYLLGEGVISQYQVLRVNSPSNWLNPVEWWKNIPPYNTTFSVPDRPISQWKVLRSELSEWCKQCDVLLNAIQAVEHD